ncbi:MAG: lytic murein transglycosylase [Candidatus Dormiibacterota bacterium]
MGKVLVAGILIAIVAIPVTLFMVLFATADQVLGKLTIKPQIAVVVDAINASNACPISGSTVLSSAVLLGASYAINGAGDTLGQYRNPWGSESDVPVQYRAEAESDLAKGGRVDRELGLGGQVKPGDWTTLLPEARDRLTQLWLPNPNGRHGFGFLLLEPSQWSGWAAEVPGGGQGLDPFSPVDSMKVLACHLHAIEAGQHLDIGRLDQSGIFQPLNDLGDLLLQVQNAVVGKYATIWWHLQQAAGDAHSMNVFQQLWTTIQKAVESTFDVISSALGTAQSMGTFFMNAVTAALKPVVDTSSSGLLWEPSAIALAKIPAAYLQLYQAWGAHFGVDWTILAGVGTIETHNGQSTAPGVHSGTNGSGAAGPMQFELPTFAAYAVDGDNDGQKDVYDPADAIATAANYLRHLGLTDDTTAMAALCHYNAGGGGAYQECMAGVINPYALLVMAAARSYRGAAIATGGATTLASNLPWQEIALTQPVGTITQIPLPAWPAGAPAHVNPATISNQCVAGALWTWGVMHASDPRWSRPPAIPAADAYQMYGQAQAEGFQVNPPTQPVAGSMVVYNAGWGGPGDGAGHVATVIGVQGAKFEVIEQNVIASSFSYEPYWNRFDVRIDQAGSPGTLGFIVSPP